ncbi:dnaJ homolog subfamily C member 22 [Hydra vulgaris]|uniref:DnaJ homolog subfamily C member 22 n=1 Tax=Hydra vulgaris TaxID=6087 RepID=A0ABM4D8C7_HYDVU
MKKEYKDYDELPKYPTKSLFITYLLWFFFGWCGLHHFYLRRDSQAFIWWSTFGGYFYLGWVRDIWRIPYYVEEANGEDVFMHQLKQKIFAKKPPTFNPSRFLGEILVGVWYGYLVHFAIPEKTPSLLLGILVSIGITVGVYLVGNIGREKGPFVKPYIAAVVCFVLFNIIQDGGLSYWYCSFLSALVFNYYRSYKQDVAKKTHLSTRISRLSGGAAIVFALWSSYFFFNASITYENGEKIYLRDSVNHFFKSPAWTDFKSTMSDIYSKSKNKTWNDFYEELVKALDPTGETNAYKVLGLNNKSSEEEVRRAYKKLAVKWHPDRHSDNTKDEAQRNFIEIQKAYEILSKRKKSTKSRDSETRTEF